MAEQFIGQTALVTLAKGKLEGVISGVISQQLTLSKVTWISTGATTDSVVIDAQDILDLLIKEGQPAVPEPILDPAIVSYGRPSSPKNGLPLDEGARRGHTFGARGDENTLKAGGSSKIQAEPSISPVTSVAPSRNATLPPTLTAPHEVTSLSASLTEPFQDLSLQNQTNGGRIVNQEQSIERQELPAPREPAKASQKKSKRGGARPGIPREFTAPSSSFLHKQDSISIRQSSRRGKRSKRRDKSLNQSPASSNAPPSQNGTESTRLKPKTQKSLPRTLRKCVRRYRTSDYDELNGWANGEATVIQDMGDFDFEENHKKFDKRKIFEEIRQEDTTADEARLVSFNRLPARAGTAGGKNLHYTENVLDPSPKTKTVEYSSDTDEQAQEPKASSDRSSSRNLSRASAKKAPPRKGSMLAIGGQALFGSSGTSDLRSRRNLTSESGPRTGPDSQTDHFRSRKQSAHPTKASLRFEGSNRTCPSLTPLQMLELEQLAVSELGLTEELMTENAARAIAETCLQIANFRINESETEHLSQKPVIVVLAGNNKTGSRAIAAARHLQNHGACVVLCILGLEREGQDDLLESIRFQLRIFRNSGGRAIKQEQLPRTLRALHAPTNLIIDAMLGMHISFDDLRVDDQASYFQLVCWANGSRNVDVVAIDVPSGIDASTGNITVHDDTSLVVNATHVLSLGAPKSGLLIALPSDDHLGDLPGLVVADIGISKTAWKKFGLRRRHGGNFGGQWVARLEYIEI